MYFFVKFELLVFNTKRVQYVEYIFLTLDQISRREKGETLEATTYNNMVNKSHLSNESMKCFKYNLKFKPIWSINYRTSYKNWIEPYPKIWTCFHIGKHRLTLLFKSENLWSIINGMETILVAPIGRGRSTTYHV
jgi:hypothetical protein